MNLLFFSVKTFNAVLNLCSELEIRHPEELSLCKPLEIEHLKYNYSQVKRAEEKRRRVTLGSMPNRSTSASSHDLDRTIVVDRPDTNTFIANRYVCVFKLHCIRIFTYVFFGLFSLRLLRIDFIWQKRLLPKVHFWNRLFERYSPPGLALL